MKQKLSYGVTFCALALLAGYVFASVGGWNITSPPNEKWFSGSKSDPAWGWMKSADKLIEAGFGLGTGSVFYVDSGVTTAGNGTSWDNAVETIDEAVNLCTAARGDVILVAAGHGETFITQSLDCDVNDITIRGLGQGSNCPTITYNHANAEVAIGADNVTIKNIVFRADKTGVLMGIEVEDGVDYFTISNCRFYADVAGTDEFVESINFVNNNTGCIIENCIFNMKAGGAAHAIFCDADTDQLTIRGCDIRGDYSVACIGGDTAASTDILIQSNILVNGALVGDSGLNAVACISLLDSTGGLIMDNYMAADTGTDIMRGAVADDCVFIENYVTDDDGDEYEGSERSGTTAVTKSEDG